MELQYDPAGRSLLKTTGVLMIVFGVFGCLTYLLGLAAVTGLAYATSGIFSAVNDLVGMGLLLAGAVVELITGILGVRAAKRPARAGKGRVVWGVLCLLLSLAGLVHIALRNVDAPRWALAFGMVLGAVVPAVYLIGAARVLRGPVAAEPEEAGETEPAEDGEPEQAFSASDRR